VRVLVTGDRRWSDPTLLRDVLDNLPSITELIEGGALGADRMAGQWAFDRGVFNVTIYADWKTYGRAAGAIRNQKMLDMKPDLVVAFHDDLANSRGTGHMVRIAKAGGVDVRHIQHGSGAGDDAG
jgi:hypothetical protein